MKPTYSQAQLEEILGKRIIDTNAVYAGLEAESMLETYAELGLLAKLDAARRSALESTVAAYRRL